MHPYFSFFSSVVVVVQTRAQNALHYMVCSFFHLSLSSVTLELLSIIIT